MKIFDKKSELDKIIQGCKKANPKAQEKLYKHFFSYGMSIAIRYSYTIDEAHEILNDAYMKIFTKIEQFNAKHSFKSWFRVILVNTAVDYYRKNAKLRLHSEIEQSERSEYSEEIVDNLTVENLMDMLNELSEKQRMVFNLYEIEGYSHKEIAVLLNISETSSRTLLTRAKKILRGIYYERFEPDEVNYQQTTKNINNTVA